MTLRYMARFADVAALMADAHAREPEVYETIIVKGDDGLVAMWAGDAGYEAEDPALPGPRHRLYMSTSTWTLDRT